MVKALRLLLLALPLGLAGCQSVQYTAFAPLDARLEPIPGGGARYFLLLNTSGRELHNPSFSAYLWNENGPNPGLRSTPTLRCSGSAAKLAPGQSIHFRSKDKPLEMPLLYSVTRVEVVGKCDEGDFRQGWGNTEAGQLRAVSASVQ